MRMWILSMALLLVGCGDLQRLVTPRLEMTLELKGPSGSEVSLILTGNGTNEVYADNGTGLTTRVTLWPGSYQASLSPLSGGPIRYQGFLAFSNSNGNITRNDKLDFQVRDVDGKSLKLVGTYRAITGSLRIVASGLPFGAVPRVGYRNTSGIEGVFDPREPAALPPGNYQLRFEDVVVDDRTYQPSPRVVVVAVEAGAYTGLNVAFAEGS